MSSLLLSHHGSLQAGLQLVMVFQLAWRGAHAVRTAVMMSPCHACRQGLCVDPQRLFRWENGQAAFNFGRWEGAALAEAAAEDPGYLVRG